MTPQIKDVETTRKIREYLEEQQVQGDKWVVYDTDNPINSKYDLYCFKQGEEAQNFARENQQIFNWHEAFPIGDLLSNIEKLEQVKVQSIINNTDLILN